MDEYHRHFICARVDNVVQYVELIKRDYPGYLNDDTVGVYFREVCPRFLLSMGSVMSKGQPISRRIFDNFRILVRRLRSMPYLQDTELTIDNGGYQVQQGYIAVADIPVFTNQFYDLITYSDLPIDWTFTLDLAPGKENIFESEVQIALLNDHSYSLAARLPENVRSRVMYIEHFYTPKLLRIWEQLRNKGLPLHFNHFSTGGLASSRTKKRPPCIGYVIPLVRVLRDACDRGLDEFRYHVLGASQFHYLLVHSLFERHIREVHRICVEITCDSTVVFSKFALSYSLPIIDWDTLSLHDISLKSGELFETTPCGMTNIEEFAENSRLVLEPYGMKPLKPEYQFIYRPGRERDTLTPLAYTYGILLYLNNFYVVEQWCRQEVERLYPIFVANQEQAFLSEMAIVLGRINESGASISKNGRSLEMAKRIKHSLEMLSSLDWDYARFIVDRYLNHG